MLKNTLTLQHFTKSLLALFTPLEHVSEAPFRNAGPSPPLTSPKRLVNSSIYQRVLENGVMAPFGALANHLKSCVGYRAVGHVEAGEGERSPCSPLSFDRTGWKEMC